MQMFSYSCYFVVISAAKVILFFKKQILHQIFSTHFKKYVLNAGCEGIFLPLLYRDISYIKQPNR